jgi:hypothetical protein
MEVILKLTKVVSVCIRRDLKVWQVSAPRILENIEAKEYELIVPTCDTKYFEKVTSKSFLIKNDEDYICPKYRAKLTELLAQRNEFSPNWLIQQFLKIMAISDGVKGDIALIWDSDTVPLCKLSFVDDDSGRLYYYHSDEYHSPYFDTTKRLLGIDRIAPYSFIAQCIPVYVEWVKLMLEEIEKNCNLPWMEAICTSISGAGNQFSEYETLGNFILSYFPEFVIFHDNKWERRGGKYFKTHQKLLNLEKRFLGFDYVALESQDFQKRKYEKFYEFIRDSLPINLKKNIKSVFRLSRPGKIN